MKSTPTKACQHCRQFSSPKPNLDTIKYIYTIQKVRLLSSLIYLHKRIHVQWQRSGHKYGRILRFGEHKLRAQLLRQRQHIPFTVDQRIIDSIHLYIKNTRGLTL